VRYVTEYAKCLIDSEEGMGATGGSSLDPYYDITCSAGTVKLILTPDFALPLLT
jgi:hypothetical protein